MRDKKGRFTKGNVSWSKLNAELMPRGENHSMYGKHHSEEAKKKISKMLKGKKFLEETRKKMSKRKLERKEKLGYVNSPETRRKISESHKGKIMSEETKRKMKIARAKQIFPKIDTKIEQKIQNFLSLLHIEFFTHKYMNIEHGYQCDILIPKQETEGVIIPQKTIIECDGDFIHCNPSKYSKDFVRFPNSKNNQPACVIWELDNNRTKELQEKGFRVIRLWENKIKVMELNDLRMRLIKW